MANDVLLCPDCGGVIGATASSGHPCTCFSAEDLATIDPTGATQAKEGTVVEAKICVVCGKDCAGHRRFKDSRGYICYACNKSQKSQELGKDGVCTQCLTPSAMGRT